MEQKTMTPWQKDGRHQTAHLRRGAAAYSPVRLRRGDRDRYLQGAPASPTVPFITTTLPRTASSRPCTTWWTPTIKRWKKSCRRRPPRHGFWTSCGTWAGSPTNRGATSSPTAFWCTCARASTASTAWTARVSYRLILETIRQGQEGEFRLTNRRGAGRILSGNHTRGDPLVDCFRPAVRHRQQGGGIRGQRGRAA